MGRVHGFACQRKVPSHSIHATGLFRSSHLERQSRKATFFMAFDWPSVFIKTRCQPCKLIVAWSACRMRPLTYTPGLRRMVLQPQPFAFGLLARMLLYCASVTPLGYFEQT